MSNTEKNRQIVQEGLDRKKNARRQRMTDAAHDAQERQLRSTINQHAQDRSVERDAALADEMHREEMRRQRAADRAQEVEDVGQVTRCMTRLFGSLFLASLMTIAFIHEAVNVEVALTTIGLTTIYCIVTFVKYATRITKKGGQHEQVFGNV